MVLASKTSLFQLLILVFLNVLCTFKFCIGLDTISLGQPLYVNQSLVSEGRRFELGFFSPGSSINYYVGIWYKNIPTRTLVWVANRETPIRQYSQDTQLVLAEDGNLILLGNLKKQIWSMNNSAVGGSSSVAVKAVLLDSGNFVLTNGMSVIWQSFDYPTDTWLPGAKVRIVNTLNNEGQVLTSWSNPNDPSPGLYSLGMDPRGSPEFFVWKNHSQVFWRSGAWNGHGFASIPDSPAFNFSYVPNEQDEYITYAVLNFTMWRNVLNPEGRMLSLVWSERGQDWNIFLSEPADYCNRFSICGPYGVCSINDSPACLCLHGFEPRDPEAWDLADWSGGCIRRTPLTCTNDGFLKISNIRIPADSRPVALDNAVVCQMVCLANCSCIAYAYSDVGKCSMWSRDLLDMAVLSSGEDLFLRSSEVPLENNSQSRKHSLVSVALIITLPLVFCISMIYLLWHIFIRRHNMKESKETNDNLLLLNLDISIQENTRDAIGNTLGGEKNAFKDLPQFSFSSISAATNMFSPANKLGEGGFGPVYKGNLLDGQSVAVKRLAKSSGQGLEELKNETMLIAKLQHRNLVRLLGCCIEQNENILIYEYMPNKSLDFFLFDPDKQDLLDWGRRVRIIEGIAQGLLYLHQHSRLRVVHRDLKASNILLDSDMNPKISDFGMARIFGGDLLQANTHRIVGTYGYMSPEYAMEGLFSTKSDVFAFGVLLLEILSGKKNTGFRHSDCVSLLGYAWELWINDKTLDLIDSKLHFPSSFRPLRFIHVGLLCVQERPIERPNISDVLAMFSNEHMQLVLPERPAFTGTGGLGSERDKPEHCSVNDLTASVMEGR